MKVGAGDTAMKTCTKCLAVKELGEFYNYHRGRDGKQPHCKVCDNIKNRKYQTENKEARRAIQSKYRDTHREAIATYNKNAKRRHPEKFRQRLRLWRENPLNMNQQARSLAVGYVVRKLIRDTSIPTDCIPNSLIEAKRLQLKIYRFINQKEKSA